MKCYGLIGRTLTHSFSKKYFEDKFARDGIKDCRYDNFELKDIQEFPLVLDANPELKGLNVTIPYKEEVIQFLNTQNDVVQEIKACNCIKIDNERKLHGYNTDAIAFQKSLQPKLKPHHKKALILGSGGAAKAIKYVLKELNINYLVATRKKEEADEIGYEDMGNDLFASYTLIINTTPLGMYPNVDADPPIPYEYLTSKHFLYDLIYNPEKTKFLCEGEKRGAQIVNGYEMLILQAEESWRIWNSNDTN